VRGVTTPRNKVTKSQMLASAEHTRRIHVGGGLGFKMIKYGIQYMLQRVQYVLTLKGGSRHEETMARRP
jgi:hypothetical protein